MAIDCFLCIDKVKNDSTKKFMLHVCDLSQKVSYTRIEIQKEPALNYSLSESQRMFMWIGESQANSYEVPAWAFVLPSDQSTANLKGALTKALYEANL